MLDHRDVPHCWYGHGTLVEEPSALRGAWQIAYDPAQPATAAVDWHTTPAYARPRLRGWAARTGCRQREHRPDSFYEATTDLDLIRSWWARWPAANIGVPTGRPHWDVVDVDAKAGAPGFQTLRRLTAAGLVDGWSHAVATPSGGLHLYFAGTDQPSSSIPAHGIDFRGLGGYVLVPPSRVHLNGIRGEYRTIDLRDRGRGGEVGWKAIRAHLTPPRALPTVRAATARGHGDADRRMTYLVRHVETRPDGQRHPSLIWAANRAVDNGSTDLTPLVAAAVRAGLPHDEAKAVIIHVTKRREVGEGYGPAAHVSPRRVVGAGDA